jgi:signal transduction histidine kinase
MARLTSTVNPQGPVGVVPFLDVALDRLGPEAGCVAILAAVRDPGNVGTVLRSADAAGAGGVVVSSASVDIYNPKAVRASAGSLFHLPIVRGVGIEEAVTQLRSRGFSTIAASPDAEATLWELDLLGPVAFLFGNEAWGLPDDVAALAERTVRFPQAGRAESLNLAAAATLFLFEWARRRAEAARPAFETLIAAAAHDIRSPLTAMKGFGFALSRRWNEMSDEQRDAMLQAIVYDTERMNGIVRQLVDAARIASGRLELFPERTDVTGLVEGMATILARDPEHPRVVWRGPPVHGLVDPERLRTVLGAFFEAAVWWASEGDIGVRAQRRGRRLRLEVERGGTQLSAVDAEGLFSPRRPGSGAGSKIGLYVARGIAEVMGGTAAANVTADGHLTFVLDVPSPDRLPGSG